MSIVHSIPVVLKWVREQSGFNLEEVARKLKRKKVTAQTIKEWERGTAFPSYSQVEDLAYKVYKRLLADSFFQFLLMKVTLNNPSEHCRNPLKASVQG